MVLKVTVDPGHGGSDPGALGNSFKEKDLNLAIALHLAKYLRASGVSVQMTRDSDRFVSLSDRAAAANRNSSDYFISVHCNAGGGKGTEVYALAPGGQAEKLAHSVLSEMIRILRLPRRGVKFANFAVLRLTDMPAVLVESAFIDDPGEEKLLHSKSGLFGKAIASGFLKFVGIPLVDPDQQILYRVFVNGKQVGAYAVEDNAREVATNQLADSQPGTRVNIVRSSDNATIFDKIKAKPPEPQPSEPEPPEPEPSEPSEPEPSEPGPSELEPSEPEPSEPGPSEPGPSEPVPSEPGPFEPEPGNPPDGSGNGPVAKPPAPGNTFAWLGTLLSALKEWFLNLFRPKT